MRTPLVLAATSLTSLSACTGCGPQDPSCALVEHDDLPAAASLLAAEEVVTGLEVPWALAFLPSGDLLVTERAGRVRRVTMDGTTGTLVAEPVLTRDVTSGGEGGLLGLALAPDFATSGTLFTYATVADGSENVIERWLVDDPAAPTSASFDVTVVRDIPANRNHDGGRLRVGPEGDLWASTGDALDPERSRDRTSLGGKLLRMTLDGEAVAGASDLVAVQGVRNSQGFDFLADGRLLVTDHGPSGEFARVGHDEINVVELGADLGWPDADACDAVDGVTAPLLAFGAALPPGGAAVRDEEGTPHAFVSALGARKLIEVDLDSGAATVHLDETHGRLRDVVVGPDGALWLTTSNCDGRGDCPESGDAILRLTR